MKNTDNHIASSPRVPNATKTYSRKRGRACSRTSTDHPSEISPVASCDDVTKKRGRTLEPRTLHDNVEKRPLEINDEASPIHPRKRLKVKRASHRDLPPTSSNIVSPADCLSLAPVAQSTGRNDRPQISSASKSSSSTTTFLSRPLVPASKPDSSLPFKRTNSQLQKENLLSQPNVLDSPFRIVISKTRRPVKIREENASISSRMARRPSMGVPATKLTPSAALKRRASGSHALQQKSTQNRFWLTPLSPRVKPTSSPARKEEGLAIDNIEYGDVWRLNSSFVPQFSSTPLPGRRSPVNSTPTTPVASAWAAKAVTPSNDMDKDAIDTPRLEEKNTYCISTPQGPISSRKVQRSSSGRIRRVMHISHDSIFSSFDFSASAGTGSDTLPSLPESDLPPPKSGLSPPIAGPEGEDLQNMFSGLGLEEGNKRVAFHDPETSPDVARYSPKKPEGIDDPGMTLKTKLRSAAQGSGTRPRSEKFSPHDKPRKRLRGNTKLKVKKPFAARMNSRLPRTAKPRPFLTSQVDDEPLMAADDEDDELLLTSNGWDWIPPALCTKK